MAPYPGVGLMKILMMMGIHGCLITVIMALDIPETLLVFMRDHQGVKTNWKLGLSYPFPAIL